MPLAHNAVLRLAELVLVYEVAKPFELLAPTLAVPGDSVASHLLRAAILKAAPDVAPVLIEGETGVGKESVAAELHRLSGRKGPLLPVNCAALSPQLAESQLFGHVKGAFTGAEAAGPGLFRAAQGGTLFLDEVGELTQELQPKLLRVLQQREVLPVGSTTPTKVDVRVIAATNRPLRQTVEAGGFRRDLYARLALWELAVVPLRERRAELVDWLRRLHQRRAGDSAGLPDLEPEAVEALLLAQLPENLRTLDRLVHALGSAHGPVRAEDLPSWVEAHGASEAEHDAERPSARRATPTREELSALLEKLGSIRATAKYLDRDRRQIYRWIEAFGIPWKD
jgi:transcriptional regulator with PAS, ATPase and Fis domain